MAEIVAPTLRAMQAMGAPFKGVLYAGLMITADGPKLIEYNVRFGDPETQVLMLRLMSDLVPALLGEPRRPAEIFDLRWYPDPALTVVMAAKGYPGDYARGSVIEGLDAAAKVEGVEIFHAGTKADGRPHPRQWRPRAQRVGDRQDGARGASARLRGDLPHPLAARILSPRYRLARDRTRGKIMPDLADLYPGYAARWIDTSIGKIFARVGGSGPPLLLLHGHPQSNVMWHRVASELATHFTLVIADLPGYGWSAVPEAEADHAPYTKRAMAAVMVEAMEALGYVRFRLAGHDRGGRVGYRLALDHPGRLEQLAVLDIITTWDMWHRFDARLAIARLALDFLGAA